MCDYWRAGKSRCYWCLMAIDVIGVRCSLTLRSVSMSTEYMRAVFHRNLRMKWRVDCSFIAPSLSLSLFDLNWCNLWSKWVLFVMRAVQPIDVPFFLVATILNFCFMPRWFCCRCCCGPCWCISTYLQTILKVLPLRNYYSIVTTGLENDVVLQINRSSFKWLFLYFLFVEMWTKMNGWCRKLIDCFDLAIVFLFVWSFD